MEEEKVILTNWSPSNPVILSSDLGWNKDDCLDAESTEPKTIFNFFGTIFHLLHFIFLKMAISMNYLWKEALLNFRESKLSLTGTVNG